MMSSDFIPRPAAGFQLEELAGELLLYHPAQEKIFYCNRPASLVWQLCDGRRTISDIIALLCVAYPEAQAAVTRDVGAVVARFRELGILE